MIPTQISEKLEFGNNIFQTNFEFYDEILDDKVEINKIYSDINRHTEYYIDMIVKQSKFNEFKDCKIDTIIYNCETKESKLNEDTDTISEWQYSIKYLDNFIYFDCINSNDLYNILLDSKRRYLPFMCGYRNHHWKHGHAINIIFDRYTQQMIILDCNGSDGVGYEEYMPYEILDVYADYASKLGYTCIYPEINKLNANGHCLCWSILFFDIALSLSEDDNILELIKLIDLYERKDKEQIVLNYIMWLDNIYKFKKLNDDNRKYI